MLVGVGTRLVGHILSPKQRRDCNGFLGLTMAAAGQLELPRFVPTDSVPPLFH